LEIKKGQGQKGKTGKKVENTTKEADYGVLWMSVEDRNAWYSKDLASCRCISSTHCHVTTWLVSASTLRMEDPYTAQLGR